MVNIQHIVTNTSRVVLVILIMLLPVKNQARPSSVKEGILKVSFGFYHEVYQDVDPKDARIAIGMWIEELVERIGEKFQIGVRTFTSLDVMERALKAGEIDMASMHTVHYLRLKDNVELVPAFIGRNGEYYGEKYVVLVRSDSHIEQFHDLKGRRFICQGNESIYNIALMWFSNSVMEIGLPRLHDTFQSMISEPKPSKALLPVFFGESDVCLISKKSYELMAELNPQLSEEMVILTESPVFLQNIACFRSGMDPEIQRQLLEVIVTIKDEPRIKQILLLFKVDDFDYFHPENLKNVLELYEQHLRLRSLETDQIPASPTKTSEDGK